jgi:hypothetical protein
MYAPIHDTGWNSLPVMAAQSRQEAGSFKIPFASKIIHHSADKKHLTNRQQKHDGSKKKKSRGPAPVVLFEGCPGEDDAEKIDHYTHSQSLDFAP